MPRLKTAIFDTETNGLLDTVHTMHLLVIKEFESGDLYVFRQNEDEDSIEEGLELLQDAETLVGHNIIGYDLKAINIIYPLWDFSGRIRDTLPLARMMFANQKQRDFSLYKARKLPAYMIGRHSLDAWGYRLGKQKMGYKALCKDLGIDPWGAWNEHMEEYCIGDVEVNEHLWNKIVKKRWSERSVVLEQEIHDLMDVQQDNGIYLDVEGAEKLADELDVELKELREQVIEHFGYWFSPAKKRVVQPIWDNDVANAKSYVDPRTEYGEDYTRAVWGEVIFPKKTLLYKDPARADRTEGAPYCAIVNKEFNPNSRQQIVDRLVVVYNWEPTDFTETGQPSVDDDVLQKLIGIVPYAQELAEIFYLLKRLGMIRDGNKAWLKRVDENGIIHGFVNVGGTVSGRASHDSPNLGQVTKVKKKKRKDKKGNEVMDKNGEPIEDIIFGRAGKHGAECRDLFYVPEPWTMIGCDLSGIEFRCLAEMCAEFDDGELIDVVLHGDIHEKNRIAAELDDREVAKTFIYAFMYGGGDWKLGHIAQPLADDAKKLDIGRHLRATFLRRMPALNQVIKRIKRQAQKGKLIGLDGRELYVRSPHSALNLKLQSDAAMIAKKWLVLNEDLHLDAGFEHNGWDGDFVQLLFVHDEDQYGIKDPARVEESKKLVIKAAKMAGEYFDFRCPVDAEAKHGYSWMETH